jgi:hypothetical protein
VRTATAAASLQAGGGRAKAGPDAAGAGDGYGFRMLRADEPMLVIELSSVCSQFRIFIPCFLPGVQALPLRAAGQRLYSSWLGESSRGTSNVGSTCGAPLPTQFHRA